MPIYSFKCPSCGKETEKIFKIASCPQSIKCDCGKDKAKKIITIGGIITDENALWLPSVVEQCKPDYDKRPVETRTELKKYLKDNGLIFTG